MGMGFNLFGVIFVLMFLIVIGTFITVAVQGIRQWNRNNNSPRLTVAATVVAKRDHISRHRHHGASGMHHSSYSTTYYVTFQFDSNDRIELPVSGQDFGLLVEGDRGQLTFQGTRYLGFQRQRNTY